MFKKGDRVRRIESGYESEGMIKGRIYTVEWVVGDDTLFVEGNRRSYSSKNFELVEEAKTARVAISGLSYLHVGDRVVKAASWPDYPIVERDDAPVVEDDSVWRTTTGNTEIWLGDGPLKFLKTMPELEVRIQVRVKPGLDS